jgi:hypothetical protein
LVERPFSLTTLKHLAGWIDRRIHEPRCALRVGSTEAPNLSMRILSASVLGSGRFHDGVLGLFSMAQGHGRFAL